MGLKVRDFRLFVRIFIILFYFYFEFLVQFPFPLATHMETWAYSQIAALTSL